MPRHGRSRSLTRDEVIDEALNLIREQGLIGLTMRKVAARLGVTPMAVYHYIADKDELVRLAVERIAGSWGPLRMGEDGWEQSLRRHLLEIWDESTRYPGLSSYLIDQPSLGVTAENLRAGIGFFEEAGFPPPTARLAWSFAMTYIHGRISVDAHLAHKPESPRLVGLRARDYVQFGVEAVIQGLRAMVATAPATGAVGREVGSRG